MKVFWSLFTKLNFPSHLFSCFSHHKVGKFGEFSLPALLLLSYSHSLIDSLGSPLLQDIVLLSTLTISALLFDKIDGPSSMVGGLSVCMHVEEMRRDLPTFSRMLSYHHSPWLVQFWQWIIDFFPVDFTFKSWWFILSYHEIFWFFWITMRKSHTCIG